MQPRVASSGHRSFEMRGIRHKNVIWDTTTKDVPCHLQNSIAIDGSVGSTAPQCMVQHYSKYYCSWWFRFFCAFAFISDIFCKVSESDTFQAGMGATHHTLQCGDAVIKPACDKLAYRSITLPNRLRVLLISDPETDKAAAALDVSSRQQPSAAGQHACMAR